MPPKLIIKPTLVTWREACLYASRSGGRLLRGRELTKWANAESIDVDIWCEGQEDDHGNAPCFRASRQARVQKAIQEKCLLVYLVDPVKEAELKRAHADKERHEAVLRRLKREKRKP